MTKVRISGLLKIAASSALIGYLLWRCNLPGLWHILHRLNVAYFLGCAGVYFFAIVADALAWMNLQSVAGLQLGFNATLRIQLIARFFFNILAGFVGEDASRFVLARDKSPGKMGALALSVLLLRVLGLLALAIVGLTATVWLTLVRGISWRAAWPLLWPISMVAGGAIMVLTILLVPSKGWLPSLLQALHINPAVRERWCVHVDKLHLMVRARRTQTAWGCSLLNQSICYAVAWLLARKLGLDVSLIEMFAVMPLVTVAVFLPVSLGGLGVREAAFLAVFAQLGLAHAASRESILALSLAYYGVNMAVGLCGGLLMMWPTKVKK